MEADIGTAAPVSGRAVAQGAQRWCWTIVTVTVGSVVVVAAASSSASLPGGPLMWLLFLGSSVHVAATLGPFTSEDLRAHARRYPVRFCWAPAGLLLLAVVGCLSPERARSVLLLAFFSWQIWHYQKQNLGLAALAAASGRRSLGPVVRQCIRVSGAGGMLALIGHPAVLQIIDGRPPHAVAAAAHALATVVIAASTTTTVAALAHRGSTTTPVAAVCLVAVVFPAPLVLTTSPYAALGGLTLAHGLQYLLLVGRVVAGAPDRRPRTDAPRLIALAAAVVAIGGVLSAFSHLHSAGAISSRLLFALYLTAVMTHFVVDGGLWRMRDDFTRHWLAARLPHLLPPPADDASVSGVGCRL